MSKQTYGEALNELAKAVANCRDNVFDELRSNVAKCCGYIAIIFTVVGLIDWWVK